MSAPATILFDGICNLCDATVRFIIANDPDGNFRFAALQSAAAAAALAPFSRDPSAAGSIIVIEAGCLYEGSSAALRVARGLRRPWRWFEKLEAIPVAVRDPLYAWVARNRYHWFGRRSLCAVPAEFARARFITDETAPANGQARQS